MPETVHLRACRVCGGTVDMHAVECPQCGVVVSNNRIRPEGHRPDGEVLANAVSDNLMGTYEIRKMPDGSLFCNCLSFLGQNGTQNGVGFSTCKHIRKWMEDNPGHTSPISNATRPSEYQNAALKRLGVQRTDYLTNDQAYWTFKELLRKQGVNYSEYRFLMGRHNNISLLPVFSFGAEFEMGIHHATGVNGVAQRLSELGINTEYRGYTHDVMASWKIVTDGSVVVDGYDPIELVTPKLFGAEGFGKIRMALGACNVIGSKVNSTCGLHVHIDACWTREELLELAKLVVKIEQKILWPLVPPSRRNNTYSKRLTRNALLVSMQYPDFHNPNRSHRYYSLNLQAYHQYKTVEFRIHNGTTDPDKTSNWIVFLLKLCDWVKRGGRSTQIQLDTLTIGSFLDLIGMGDNATSRLRRSRDYILERYNHWMQDAAMHTANQWTLDGENADDLTLVSRPRAAASQRVSRATAYANTPPGRQPANHDVEQQTDRIESFAHTYYDRAALGRPLTPSAYSFRSTDYDADNLISVGHLAFNRHPTRRIRYADIAAGAAEQTWRFPSESNPDRVHETTLNVFAGSDGNDLRNSLSCTCQAFRGRRYCVHTISVARYYVMQEYARRRIS